MTKKLNFEAWFRIQNKKLKLIVAVDSWSLTFVELVAPKGAVVLLSFVLFILLTLLTTRCSMV